MIKSTLSTHISMYLLFALIFLGMAGGIVDFQYTQYVQTASHNSHHRAELNFKPIQVTPEYLQFPQACNLIERLSEPLKAKQNQIVDYDVDHYLNDMKQKFLDLLTLTQKLSNSQAKILHFEDLINKTNPIVPSSLRLKRLENLQHKLQNLTSDINLKNNQLKDYFSTINRHSNHYHQGQAKRIQLDYDIQLLRQKISYLQNFQQRARSAIANSGPQHDYNKYFDDLARQFNNQSSLIQNIDLIIRKKEDLTRLRKQRTNLQSSIMALDLYIKDVQLCHKEKQNIRQEFKNHQKINQLIHELKQLKKNEEPNIYCEGVVIKLTQKIRTMLRYYDIVASCASDLSEKMNALKKEKQELQEVNEKIARLQQVSNLQDFQKTYKKQKNAIQVMYSKIKDWKMKEFAHNPEQIAQLRNKVQHNLQQLIRQREAITPSQLINVPKSISVDILNLINHIKKAKHQYCELYHEYDSLANALWTQAYQYQSQMNLKRKLMNMERQQRTNYENYHRQLTQLRNQIYEKLNK